MDDHLRRSVCGPEVGDATFDAHYFAHCCGAPYQRDEHWTRFFDTIASHIVSGIQPQRVLDAGCALGLLVEALRARGVDAEGIDLSSHAIANVFDPIKPFCRHGSIADEFPARYDLIVSIEVLEHMPARDGEAAVANMCRHTDDVLFSSTPLDYREPSHVNVQQPEHWAELFARQGFYRDVDFDASFITPWAVRFRRSAEPLPRIVRNYERRFWALNLERNETRSFSADVQRRLAETLERLSSAEGELERVRQELARAGQELARVEQERAHARSTIEHMERSLFWKLRRVWVTINRLVGRST